MDLTERQIAILKVVMEEYIESAEPVGSENLDRKFSLGISPATIRNEMVRLTQLGYLKQPHISAGRVPTKKAFHFYVSQLVEEKGMSVAEEVAAREKVWDVRFDFDRLMHEAVRSLAQQSRALAVAAADEGELYHAGYANILSLPEFYDIDVTRTILGLLDETRTLRAIFGREVGEEAINVLFGDEIGFECLEPCGLIFTRFAAGNHKGALGVIGANRFCYPEVVPMVRYYGGLIEEIAGQV
jgi:heat-inducible transcriptional repressor